MTNEVWKDIPDYEGIYQASTLGRIRSLPRTGTYLRILKTRINKKTGYERITLLANRKKKDHCIHRLIMLAFVGESDLDVNHKNGIKGDNRLENLEYSTKSENMKHSYKTGLSKAQVGENVNGSKLKEKQVFEIKKLIQKKKLTLTKIAEMFNVHVVTISDIKRNVTWKHIGV